jgi:hypothetical protein
MVTGRDISTVCWMGNHAFSNDHFEKWLTGLLPRLYNHDLDSILYWEQRAGNWIAMCNLEFDIAWKDIFTPYNCRELLIHMLSVPVKYRNPPKFKLHRRTIRNLWPETLDIPVNPHRNKSIYTRTREHLQGIIPQYIQDPIRYVVRKVAI